MKYQVTYRIDDGSSMLLRNVGLYLREYKSHFQNDCHFHNQEIFQYFI